MVVRVHVTRDITLYILHNPTHCIDIRAPAIRPYISMYFKFALFSCDTEQAEKSTL